MPLISILPEFRKRGSSPSLTLILDRLERTIGTVERLEPALVFDDLNGVKRLNDLNGAQRLNGWNDWNGPIP